ncbi:hypothetical protein [Pseudomonas sp. EA_65y_Pfl1_P113]|uniref:hypothetical protein n=1 Tax=Pseudomonas sp. EA_65y_Pfl1_P113 TaxID=3088692 RepID=UPI0030D93810
MKLVYGRTRRTVKPRDFLVNLSGESINIVKVGIDHIKDDGSLTLISGILNVKPIPQAITDATTNGAIDTFVKCGANELPRGIRIDVVNPTLLIEAWEVYGEMMRGF